MRKQKRVDKKIKKMPVPKAMRPDHRATAPAQSDNKGQPSKQVNGKKDNIEPKKRQLEEKILTLETPSKKKKDNKSDSLKKLSNSNPLFYSLIESENLITKDGVVMDTSDKAVEQDDLAIAMYEKKLGLDKKRKKAKDGDFNLGSAFEEDGLMDILDGLGSEKSKSGSREIESNHRGAGISIPKGSKQHVNDDSDEEESDEEGFSDEDSDFPIDDESDGDVNDALDAFEGGFDSDQDTEDEDEEEDEDVDFEDELEDSDLENELEASELEDEDQFDSEDEYLEMPNDDEAIDKLDDAEVDRELDESDKYEPSQMNGKEEGKTNAVASTPATTAGKYIPPHLREKATTKSEQQIRLQRALQGLLNKLSESNLESILMEIEKCYANYPRHGKK